MKGKDEVSSLQEDLQEANRQREQLEKQKQEVQGQLEEIDNQVSGEVACDPSHHTHMCNVKNVQCVTCMMRFGERFANKNQQFLEETCNVEQL